MNSTFLQWWGGIFYLLAKIFLLKAEGNKNISWQKLGWLGYLIGVPAWLMVLFSQQNWIACAVEFGGIPSMLLGLSNKKPKIILRSMEIFLVVLVIISIIYSLKQTNSAITQQQCLEFGVTFGFLFGTYLLARENYRGWLLFMLMHISMGTLMIVSGKFIMATLQFISLGIALAGFIKAPARKKIKLRKDLRKVRTWDLANITLWQKLCKYFQGESIVHNDITVQPILDCGFEITIWHNKPCLGEDGPNPGIGTPVTLKQLKGDEKFTLDLYDVVGRSTKYNLDTESGYHKDFICSISFGKNDFEAKEYIINDWYRYSIAIQSSFGVLILGFEHENAYVGKCEIMFNI